MKRTLFIICIFIVTNISANTSIHNYIINSPEYKTEENSLGILELQLKNSKKELIPDSLNINGNIGLPGDFSSQSYTVSGTMNYSIPFNKSTVQKRLELEIEAGEYSLNSIYNTLGFKLESKLIELEKLYKIRELYIKSIENETLRLENIRKIYELGELSRSDINRAKLTLNKKALSLELLKQKISSIEESIAGLTNIRPESFLYSSESSINAQLREYPEVSFTKITKEYKKKFKELAIIERSKDLLPDLTIRSGVSYDFNNPPVISLGGTLQLPIRNYSKSGNTKEIEELEIKNLDQEITRAGKNFIMSIKESESNIERYHLLIKYLKEDLKLLENSINDIAIESKLGSKTVIQKIAIEDDIFHYKELEIEYNYGLMEEILKLNFLKGGLKYD